MSEFKKVAIYVDENKISGLVQPQESRIEYFQELVNRYVGLNTGVPLQKADLKPLIENPKEFIAKRLIKEETLSIGGLQLNFEKMFDIIEKPAGTEELINKIINDVNVKELMMNQRNVDYFEIENENTVVLNAEYLTKTTEQNTVYLINENQVEAFEVLKTIAESFNTLNGIYNGTHLQERIFDNFFDTNTATGKVAINPYFGNLIR
jgi:hypothetical protein